MSVSTDDTVSDRGRVRDEGAHGRSRGKSFGLVLGLSLMGLLMYDFKDIILADYNRQKALSSITLGARLTQAERELNAAGYNTLYIGLPRATSTEEVLEVSTMHHRPLLADLVLKMLPKRSYLAEELEYRLRIAARFYIKAEFNAGVVSDASGRPKSFFYEEGLL